MSQPYTTGIGQQAEPLCFAARNFRNINPIGTKSGTNQCHLILNIKSYSV